MGGTGICIGRGSLLEGNVEGNKKGGEPLSRQIGDLMGKIYDDPLFDRKAGTENGIVNCLIYNVGAGGINMGGGNRTTLEHGNNYVEIVGFILLIELRNPIVRVYGWMELEIEYQNVIFMMRLVWLFYSMEMTIL